MATKTIKTSGGDYTTLSAWEAGEQADITGLGPSVAECYSMSDTTAVVIAGWTTTASDYIRIYTPTSERHDGKWNTSKYRLTSGNSTAIDISEDFVRIDGLQLYHDGVSADNRYAVNISGTGAGAVIYVTNCILRGNNNGSWYDSGVNTTSTAVGTIYIYNNMIYDWGRSGSASHAGICINAPGAASVDAYVYNNTIQNCHYGISRLDSDIFAVNNLFSASVTADAAGTFAAGTDYNATNAASIGYTVTGGGNTHDRTSQTFTFVDAANDDFHLQSGDAGAKDFGSDLSGTFTTDIDGATRSGTWDIGADEFTSGATSHALSATAASAASTVGALILSLALAGSAASASATSGQLRAGRSMTASAASASMTAGSLTEGIALNGTSVGVSTATGTLSIGGAPGSHALSATAASTSTTTGALGLGLRLTGSAASVSTVNTAALLRGTPISGTAGSTSATAEALLSRGHALGGTSTAASVSTGTATAGYALRGTAASTSTATGVLGGGTAVVPVNLVITVSTPRQLLEQSFDRSPRRRVDVASVAKRLWQVVTRSA